MQVALLVLVLLAILFAFYYWYYTLAAVLVILGIMWYRKDLKAKQAEMIRLRQNDEHIARTRRLRQEQEVTKREALAETVRQAILSFEALPRCLTKAETLLDRSENDFAEGVFAPFWDSVENATMQLGHYDNNVNRIFEAAEQYTVLLTGYKGTPPFFPIDLGAVRAMAAASTTTERLKVIVRNGQSNFQFATIFEQRKTNQLLVAGFTNLAQALNGMSNRIENSIDRLSDRVSSMSEYVGDAISSLETEVVFGNKLSEAEAERTERTLEMLDNIQRRRVPLPRELGDGKY